MSASHGIEAPTLMLAHYNNRVQAHKEQRNRGANPSIQQLCYIDTAAYISSITLVSTARSTQNRFNRYKEFCEAVNVPCFPIVGPIMALWIFDISGGKDQAWEEGRTYDSHTTVLNAIRRATLDHFSVPSTPTPTHNLAAQNVLDFPPLKQYMSICRAHAHRTKVKRVASLGSPAKKFPGSISHSNLSTVHSTTSAASGGSAKKPVAKPKPSPPNNHHFLSAPTGELPSVLVGSKDAAKAVAALGLGTPTSAGVKRGRKASASPAPALAATADGEDIRRSGRKSIKTSKAISQSSSRRNLRSGETDDSGSDSEDEIIPPARTAPQPSSAKKQKIAPSITQDASSSKTPATVAAPSPRPRGRPRKHPLPIHNSASTSDNLTSEDIVAGPSAVAAASSSSNTSTGRPVGRPSKRGRIPSAKEVGETIKDEVEKVKQTVQDVVKGEGDEPEGTGVFGKITKWFGWGAQ